MALILSVCIPVYHASATIDRCLAAVARQLPSEAEILLVDNASKDDTVAVARRTLTAAPNVQVVIQDRNVGRVANWNRCLELATGRYVKFALANDVLMNGAIALLLAEARRHPDAVMICSRAKFVDTTSDREMVNAETAKSIRRDTAETLEFFGRHGFQTGGLNGMLYRREPLIEHGIFFREDLPYCADYYLAIQLAAQGPSVFLDTETYMFDKSVASRFHFA
nr:glycosyltransferase [Burkholderiales bacterium]